MKPILEHDGKRFEVLSSAGYPRPGEWVLGTNGSDVKPIRAPMDFCSSTITTLRELPCHTNGKPILRADVPFNGTYEVWTTDCPPDIPANTQNASRESLKFVRKLGERVWSRVIDAPPLIEVGSVWRAGFDPCFPQYNTTYGIVMAQDTNGRINGSKMPRVDLQHFGSKFFGQDRSWHQGDFLRHFRQVPAEDVVVGKDGDRRRRFVKIGFVSQGSGDSWHIHATGPVERHPCTELINADELLPLDFLDPEPVAAPKQGPAAPWVSPQRCKTYSGNFLCVNCGHFVNIQVPVGLEKKNFVISTVKCPICETYCLTK